MPEKAPRKETELADQEMAVADRLREHPQDPEARAAFLELVGHWEAEANRENSPHANMAATLKRARAYIFAGLYEAAWDNLEGVREEAANQGEQEFFDMAERMMSDIDDRQQ